MSDHPAKPLARLFLAHRAAFTDHLLFDGLEVDIDRRWHDGRDAHGVQRCVGGWSGAAAVRQALGCCFVRGAREGRDEGRAEMQHVRGNGHGGNHTRSNRRTGRTDSGTRS